MFITILITFPKYLPYLSPTLLGRFLSQKSAFRWLYDFLSSFSSHPHSHVSCIMTFTTDFLFSICFSRVVLLLSFYISTQEIVLEEYFHIVQLYEHKSMNINFTEKRSEVTLYSFLCSSCA